MIFDRLYPHLPPGYLLKSGFELLISGTFFFVGVETYTLNEKFYEKVVCIHYKIIYYYFLWFQIIKY